MIDRFHEPPIFADRFRSDDLDEIRAFMDNHNGAHWRRAHGRGPVGFDVAVLGAPQVAASVGIDHLGRFAARYRRLYGESPSATLRRSVRSE